MLKVVYDACVLYPVVVRDFLLRLSAAAPFDARWTNKIHDEWIGNLLKNRPNLDPKALNRTRKLMNEAFVDCLVEEYEPLIDQLTLPDFKDRHVLAAAIHSGANTIVTYNLKHFPPEALALFSIEALHPDKFVEYIIELFPNSVLNAAKISRNRFKNPSFTVEEYI